MALHASDRTRRIVMALTALCCAVALAAGGALLFVGADPAALAGALATTEEAQGAGTRSEEGNDNQADRHAAATSQTDGDSAAQESSATSAGSAQAGAKASGGSISQDGGGEADTDDGASGTASGDATSGSQTPGSSAAGGADTSRPNDEATITVTVHADSSAADGSVSFSQTVTLPAGSSVYDALLATDVPVNARNSIMGVYVTGIGGLAEFDFEGSSGWTFQVNGVPGNRSCDRVELTANDVVTWVYVV